MSEDTPPENISHNPARLIEFQQSIIDGVRDPVIVIGLDLKVLAMNIAAKTQFLTNVEGEIPDTLCHQVVYGCDTPCGGVDKPCPMHRAIESGQAYTTVHTLRGDSGMPRQVEMMGSPLFDSSGQIYGMVEVLHQNTDLFNAMEEIRQNESRLKAIMDGVIDGIVMTDTDGIIESCNPAMERMLGYDQGELLGRNVTEFMPESKNIIDPGKIRKYLGTNGVSAVGKHGHELTVLNKDGAKFQVTVDLGVAGDDDKRRLVAIIHDWAEKRRMIRELEEAREKFHHREKLATVGQLTAGIIHEVGNPIAAISGSVSVLLRRLKKSTGDDFSPESTIEALETIQDHIARLLRVTREISGLAMPGNDSVELLDINNLVRFVINLMHYDARFRKINTVFEPDITIPAVLASSDQITQVLMNLIINAADACSVEGREEPEIKVSTFAETGWLMVTVQDNGIGMNENAIKHIFDEFYTTKKNGHGIGLPLSRSIVRDLGGDLLVESKENVGSKITIKLPADN